MLYGFALARRRIKFIGAAMSGQRKRKHVKVELELPSDSGTEKEASPSKKAAARGVSLDPPPHWQTVYDSILEMRKARNAPVDQMGCERAHDLEAEPKVQRFQCLVSLMLSSMTKDEVRLPTLKLVSPDFHGKLPAELKTNYR